MLGFRPGVAGHPETPVCEVDDNDPVSRGPRRPGLPPVDRRAARLHVAHGTAIFRSIDRGVRLALESQSARGNSLF